MLDYAYPPETALPYLLLLVETLKAVSWPAAIAVAIWWLRNPILNIFPRIVGLKTPGLEINLASAKEIQIAKTKPEDEYAASVVANLPRTDAISEMEMRVNSELQKYPENEREKLLVNAVAGLNVEKHFLFVYINIFGSQIRALQAINEQGGQVAIDVAERSFSEIKESIPELRDWTLERYSAFLESNGLLVRDQVSIRLTDAGRDFISFLVRFGLSTQKPL